MRTYEFGKVRRTLDRMCQVKVTEAKRRSASIVLNRIEEWIYHGPNAPQRHLTAVIEDRLLDACFHWNLVLR